MKLRRSGFKAVVEGDGGDAAELQWDDEGDSVSSSGLSSVVSSVVVRVNPLDEDGEESEDDREDDEQEVRLVTGKEKECF